MCVFLENHIKDKYDILPELHTKAISSISSLSDSNDKIYVNFLDVDYIYECIGDEKRFLPFLLLA